MKMKKTISTILALTAVVCLLLSLTACAMTEDEKLAKAYNKYLAEVKAPADATDTLTIATSPDFAPMEFSDLSKSGSDSYVGFDILLANYIAKETGKKLVIKPMSFDACMAAVQSGNVDMAVSGFSWTAERAENFLITDYYVAGENETEQVTISLKDTAASFTNADSFAGKKVGAQGGSLQELLVTEQLVPKGAELVKMENLNDLVTALKNGQIDALACAKGNGDAFIAADPDQVSGTSFSFVVEEKYKNNVILLNKNSTALLEEVNAILAKAMSADLYTPWYEACEVYSGISTLDEAGFDDDGNKIAA